MWKKLNSVLNRRETSTSVDSIISDGTQLGGIPLANAFNDYFANVANRGCNCTHTYQINGQGNNNCIFLCPVTENEIVSVFLGIKNSNSCDADNIQITPVKYVIGLLASHLAHIFNLCILSASFPKNMQLAKVSIIHKKGDKNNMTNYRPVSILPVFSKGLEKIICARLTSFCDKYNVLTDAQFGFRKNRSTELALLEAKKFTLRNFEETEMVLRVFIDFTKGFDYLDHSLLIKKLDFYGIRRQALALMLSYLSNRRQYVNINSSCSTTLPISTGVPQPAF